MPPLFLPRFKALTFDCYGTLIDWERGILRALRRILKRHGVSASDREILGLYSRLEPEIERPPFKRYRKVLSEVVRGFGRTLGFKPTEAEVSSLARSVRDWPPFPDTVAALRALRRRYRLVIVSNVDKDLFQGSARRLRVPFDLVVTAQEARSYKPSLNNFRLALGRIHSTFGLGKAEVLHVAQSLHHDHVPAKRLGLKTVWVNRRKGKEGSGATPPSRARPDLEVPDLITLAKKAGLA